MPQQQRPIEIWSVFLYTFLPSNVLSTWNSYRNTIFDKNLSQLDLLGEKNVLFIKKNSWKFKTEGLEFANFLRSLEQYLFEQWQVGTISETKYISYVVTGNFYRLYTYNTAILKCQLKCINPQQLHS